MPRSDTDTKWTHSLIGGLARGAIMGLVSGIILGFVEVILGLFFAKMSINTYIGIFIAFISSCMFLGILTYFIIMIFLKSKKKFTHIYHSIYFISLLFNAG